MRYPPPGTFHAAIVTRTSRVATSVAVLLVIASCASQPLAGDPSAVPSPDVEPIAGAIQAVLESADYSGAALVVRDGEVLYRGALGFADAKAEQPNTPETRFKLGSVYKQLSAGLILTMARDGMIDVDGSLCQGIPDCPTSLADVTYHQVLTHSSGIGELTDTETSGIASNEDALRVIGDAQREFEPGEGWSYSNTAYSLLTATPELVTGNPLPALERERVYEPVGMSDTALDGFDGPPEGAAVGYTAPGERPSDDPFGNWSTVDDLWAWHRALRAGDPIPSSLVALMETPHVDGVNGVPYGYGVEVRDVNGRTEISHRGGTEGFSAYLIRYPDDDSVIVLLSNSESTDVDVLRERLIEVVFGEG
ncbi:MAG: serine hydrolase domain-containing protein [Candidatus Limnocylindria bacterium]